jgi:hypothetical protein
MERGGGGARGDGQRVCAQANVFVYNLHKEVGDAELFALFQGFGTILSTRVCVARPSGRSKVGPPGALLV